MLKSLDNLSIAGIEEKQSDDALVGAIQGNINTVVDGIHPIALPNSSNDSRKLLDNNFIVKLTIDQQQKLYNNLCSLVQEALFDTEKQTNDEKIKKYNDGVNCALSNIIHDLKCRADLYYLCSKYNRIIGALIVLFEELEDVSEVNYIQTSIRGKLAAYTNFLEVLKEKLSKEENEIFRQGNLPVVR